MQKDISVCFGPNVLKSPKDGAEVLTDIEVQCKVVETFILHRAEFFGVYTIQTIIFKINSF